MPKASSPKRGASPAKRSRAAKAIRLTAEQHEPYHSEVRTILKVAA